MESSIVYGSAKIKAAPIFKRAQKKWPAARALFAVFWLFLVSFIFPAKTAITVGRLFEDKQLRVVWFCRLPLSKLEDWAQSVFNRLATPPPPSVMRKFFGWTTRIECNIFISFEFSGKRELAFIYPYFELIFAKQEWGALLYSILYFINNRQQRWAKLQSIVFSQGNNKNKIHGVFPPFEVNCFKISLISLNITFQIPKR